MIERIPDSEATVEDHRAGIMEDVINRYLADEITLRQLTDAVTIWRLHFPWPREESGGWLRDQTYFHLHMFRCGEWTESALRDSLAFLCDQARGGGFRFKTPMFDEQWLALMQAGHLPPGVTFITHTEESIRAMPSAQRREFGRKLANAKKPPDWPDQS